MERLVAATSWYRPWHVRCRDGGWDGQVVARCRKLVGTASCVDVPLAAVCLSSSSGVALVHYLSCLDFPFQVRIVHDGARIDLCTIRMHIG